MTVDVKSAVEVQEISFHNCSVSFCFHTRFHLVCGQPFISVWRGGLEGVYLFTRSPCLVRENHHLARLWEL